MILCNSTMQEIICVDMWTIVGSMLIQYVIIIYSTTHQTNNQYHLLPHYMSIYFELS